MTIADSKTSPSTQTKSWRERLRGSGAATAGAGGRISGRAIPGIFDGPGGPAGAGGMHKLGADSVDLWIMSAVDTKMPPASAGSGELLDTIVQQHLQSAGGPGEAPAD